MKTIKIGFVDVVGPRTDRSNYIVSILEKSYKVEFSSKPDYLFYAEFGERHLDYDCIRIFVAGENEIPDFNICDYATGFAHMSFGDRYLRYPYYLRRPQSCERMKTKHLNVNNTLFDREFCSFVYSNARAIKGRSQLLDAISAYRPVRSGGRFHNNVGGPVADKLAFEQQHKFSIACENSVFPGYTTEKLADAFAAQTVPIYFGDPRITEVFNRDAMIVVADYPDAEALIQRIREVDENREEYLRMLRTPALLEPDHVERMNAALEEFLCNIMEQEYEQAFRRCRDFRGELYLRKRRQSAEPSVHPYRYAWKLIRDVTKNRIRSGYLQLRRLGGRILRKLKLRK